MYSITIIFLSYLFLRWPFLADRKLGEGRRMPCEWHVQQKSLWSKTHRFSRWSFLHVRSQNNRNVCISLLNNKDLITHIVCISWLIGYWTNYCSSESMLDLWCNIHLCCDPGSHIQLYLSKMSCRARTLFSFPLNNVYSQLGGGWISTLFTFSTEEVCFVCLPNEELFSWSKGTDLVVLSAVHVAVKDGCPRALLSPLVH